MADSDQARYFTSNATTLSITEGGAMIASSSLSRNGLTLSEAALSTLRAFTVPAAAASVYETVRKLHGLDRPAFDAVVAELVSNELIVDERAPKTDTKTGFGSLNAHHSMLKDYQRVASYRQAIMARAKGLTALDVGTGTGILSIFAAQAGAKHVYAIEETAIGGLAKQMFAANGVAETVTLVAGNSRNIALPEEVDLIIHEIFGADPFAENVLPIITDVRTRFGAPNVQMLPERIDVYCLGLELERTPNHAARSRMEAADFAGRYGVNFAPYISALEKNDERPKSSIADLRKTWREVGVLTEPCLLRSVDFRTDDVAKASKVALSALKTIATGRLGRLWVYFDIHLGAGMTLSTAPWTTSDSWGAWVVELPVAHDVHAGQELAVTSRVAQGVTAQSLMISVKPVS